MSRAIPGLVVIADDDPDVLRWMSNLITNWGCRVAAAETKGELLTLLTREQPQLVLLDLRFGSTDGLELLQQIRAASPDLPVALLTGHGSIDAAVSAIRAGAYDFLTKPPDQTRLRMLIAHAAEKQALAARVRKLESVTLSPALHLASESQSMQRTVKVLQSVAPTDATVLILGESGTGKELAARMVHELSQRKNGPFVPVNTAAIPRELAESLLFGHEKGAFTGADRVQAGVCELADGGTLFMDEIGEMELGLQAKLLRFLQERTLQRVGSSKLQTVDVRVVAATNRDLLERVKAGQFREDLYYRLNVIPVRLPALRERREDIPILACRFLHKAAIKYGHQELRFTPEMLVALQNEPWPGNVRQLENVVERLAILTMGPEIGPEALERETPAETARQERVPETTQTVETPIASESTSEGSPRLLDQMEKQAILNALEKSLGVVRDAAYQLGLSQATMYRKIKRYGVDLAKFAPTATD
jgi:DNA-binding NtrC family response regulator